jgi:hypothetical protein
MSSFFLNSGPAGFLPKHMIAGAIQRDALQLQRSRSRTELGDRERSREWGVGGWEEVGAVAVVVAKNEERRSDPVALRHAPNEWSALPSQQNQTLGR